MRKIQPVDPGCLEVRSMLAGILSRRNTASHRCHTELRALPLGPLLLSKDKKNEDARSGASVKEFVDDFLRRHYPHQVKGSKVCPSSQPVSTSSPVFSSRLYYRLHKIAIGLIALRKAFYLPAAHN